MASPQASVALADTQLDKSDTRDDINPDDVLAVVEWTNGLWQSTMKKLMANENHEDYVIVDVSSYWLTFKNHMCDLSHDVLVSDFPLIIMRNPTAAKGLSKIVIKKRKGSRRRRWQED